MKLKIKPFPKNNFPLRGLLIKSTSPREWILEIQRMGLDFSKLEIYPLPGVVANSVWGCFLELKNGVASIDLGRNECCQQMTKNLFIAEKSTLHPKVTDGEIAKLFPGHLYVMHPEFGIAELNEPIDFVEFLVEPKSEEVESIQPLEPLFVPKRITGFQVIMAPEEDVLGDLEQTVKPEKMDLSEKPLSPIEKAKLMLYRKLLAAEEGKDGKKTEAGGSGAIGALGSLLGSLAKGIPGMDKMTDEMKKELEDLERRNKRKVEKFMDMLRDNPDEALKYAMPLDDKNTGRGSDAGGMGGEWNMSTRWGDFSLFGDTNYRGRGGGGIDLGDEYFQLQQQYRDTAQAFEKKGKYRKAAFVYFKLLKDYHNAATTLEKGKIYKQAAQVYLKHANNKSKAAECYEKGNLFQEAIDLNIELLRYEKAGDLFLKINERKKADVYYQKTADNYIKSNQYVKASLVYRNKMGERMKGQDILMKGWKNNRDAYNCLNNYFANIEDEKSLSKEMDQVFQNHVSDKNRRSFLRILHHEYDKKNSLGSQVREIAYEAIHEEIKNNPEVVTELKFFNKNDRQLIKDSIRFRSSKNKKKR